MDDEDEEEPDESPVLSGTRIDEEELDGNEDTPVPREI